jgi:hypothetical protein
VLMPATVLLGTMPGSDACIYWGLMILFTACNSDNDTLLGCTHPPACLVADHSMCMSANHLHNLFKPFASAQLATAPRSLCTDAAIRIHCPPKHRIHHPEAAKHLCPWTPETPRASRASAPPPRPPPTPPPTPPPLRPPPTSGARPHTPAPQAPSPVKGAATPTARADTTARAGRRARAASPLSRPLQRTPPTRPTAPPLRPAATMPGLPACEAGGCCGFPVPAASLSLRAAALQQGQRNTWRRGSVLRS